MLTWGDVVAVAVGFPLVREAGYLHPAVVVTAQRLFDASRNQWVEHRTRGQTRHEKPDLLGVRRRNDVGGGQLTLNILDRDCVGGDDPTRLPN